MPSLSMLAGPTCPARTMFHTMSPLPARTTATPAMTAIAVTIRRRILRLRASRRRTSTISSEYAACSFFESLRRCLLVRAVVGVCSAARSDGAGADFGVDGIPGILGNAIVSSLVGSHDLTEDGPHDRDRDPAADPDPRRAVRALPRTPRTGGGAAAGESRADEHPGGRLRADDLGCSGPLGAAAGGAVGTEGD